jgi:hypothetical protein
MMVKGVPFLPSKVKATIVQFFLGRLILSDYCRTENFDVTDVTSLVVIVVEKQRVPISGGVLNRALI